MRYSRGAGRRPTKDSALGHHAQQDTRKGKKKRCEQTEREGTERGTWVRNRPEHGRGTQRRCHLRGAPVNTHRREQGGAHQAPSAATAGPNGWSKKHTKRRAYRQSKPTDSVEACCSSSPQHTCLGAPLHPQRNGEPCLEDAADEEAGEAVVARNDGGLTAAARHLPARGQRAQAATTTRHPTWGAQGHNDGGSSASVRSTGGRDNRHPPPSALHGHRRWRGPRRAWPLPPCPPLRSLEQGPAPWQTSPPQKQQQRKETSQPRV